MMIRLTWVCVTLLALIGFDSVSRAADLEKMPTETAQLFAKHLSDLFNKEHLERQAKFEVDPIHATGLLAGQDGIIAVPIRGLKEGTIDPAVESENGGGLCYLFLSPCFTPLIDGKPIDAKKLRRVKFDNGQGGQREAICLIITAKHVEGDDWRLFAFGADKGPVINSKFGESTESPEKELAIRVTEAKDTKANLELTLYKKYSSSFAIGIK